MFISRATLRAPDDGITADDAAAISDPYGLHRLVWRLFSDGPDRRRDFLYRLDIGPRGPVLMAVSERPPRETDPLWHLTDKPKLYDPTLAVGERLGFILRANPVVAAWTDGGRERGRRHDVVMDHKQRNRDEWARHGGAPPEATIVQEACAEWLARKADGSGFSVSPDACIAGGFRTHRFKKPNSDTLVHISGVDLAGELVVKEPDRLRTTLFTGIGPAKGFGFGLLMVRRC